MAWNTRFKQVSAAKRRAKESVDPPAPRRFEEHVVDEARRTSPEPFLRRHYPQVKATASGNVVWVPKVLRCDFDLDRWVSCGWEEEPIGDNLALVQWVAPGTSFPDAVRELTGAEAVPGIRPTLPAPSPAVVLYPRLPPVEGEDRGRAYLRGRGISEDSIRAAEEAGILRYVDSGVIFLGRDLASPTRSVRAATIRYFDGIDWRGDVITKRDLSNTDKGYPGILPGDPCRVLVVESGTSALGARDIVVRRGEPAPTLIVTGGVNARRWATENESVRRILEKAQVVEIWGENETSPEKQQRTDAVRGKLQLAIAEQRQGELPVVVYPPGGFKDAADWNRSLACGPLSDHPGI